MVLQIAHPRFPTLLRSASNITDTLDPVIPSLFKTLCRITSTTASSPPSSLSA